MTTDTSGTCPGCEHPLSQHFKDVTGVVRCLYSRHGLSDRGVIGIPWTEHCDCADYVSVQGDQRREQERLEREESEARTAAMVERIRQVVEKK